MEVLYLYVIIAAISAKGYAFDYDDIWDSEWLLRNTNIRVRRQNGYKYERPSISFELPMRNAPPPSSNPSQGGYPSNEPKPSSPPAQPQNLYSTPELSAEKQPTSNSGGTDGYDKSVPAQPLPTYTQPSQQSDGGYPSIQSDGGYPSKQSGEGYPSKQSDEGYPSKQFDEESSSKNSDSNSYDYQTPNEPIAPGAGGGEGGPLENGPADQQYAYPKPETSTAGKPYLPPKIGENSIQPKKETAPSNSYIEPSPNQPTDVAQDVSKNSESSQSENDRNYLPPISQNQQPQTVKNNYVPPSNPPSSGYAPSRNTPTISNDKYGPPKQAERPTNKYVPPSNPPSSGYAPSKNTPAISNDKYGPPKQTEKPSNKYVPPSNPPSSGYAPSKTSPTVSSDKYVPPKQAEKPSNRYVPPSNPPTSGYASPKNPVASNKYVPPRPADKPSNKYVPPSAPSPFVPLSTPASTYLPPY